MGLLRKLCTQDNTNDLIPSELLVGKGIVVMSKEPDVKDGWTKILRGGGRMRTRSTSSQANYS